MDFTGASGSVPLVLRVVASLVWGLLRWAALAEDATVSASFCVIVLGLICGLAGGMVLVSFLLGDIHGGISKYLMFGLLPWGFLLEGVYRSSFAAIGFCASGGPAHWVWGSCTGGCGGGGVFGWGCLPWGPGLLACGICEDGFGFLGGLWLWLFGGVCFCRPLVYVFCFYFIFSF